MTENVGADCLDLPLMSNADVVHISHYVLDLSCDIEAKRFTGSMFLVCEPLHCECRSQHNDPSVEYSENLKKSDVLMDTLDTDLLGKSPNLNVHKSVIISDMEKEFSTAKNFDSSDEHTYARSKGLNGYHETGFALTSMKGKHCDTIKDKSCTNKETFTGISLTNEEIVSKEPTCQLTDCRVKTSDNKNNVCCRTDFIMVLDAWNLELHSVSEILFENDHEIKHFLKKLNSQKDNETNFITKEWIRLLKKTDINFRTTDKSVEIWKPGVRCPCKFPPVLEINYSTQPDGPSLKWTLDQDKNLCVYTHGHWINNRSMFPSQDVPEALSTWSAYVTVPSGFVVLMSGDHNPDVSIAENGWRTYHYYTEMEMPSSTLALAVGRWRQVDIPCEHPLHTQESAKEELSIPSRLFTPELHLDASKDLILPYLPVCMKQAVDLLGTYPFKRLDVLIVPDSFASLGMASPSLIFLSQSVLSRDGEMLVRLAHEVSHSWFGLLIGPKDWHEEWLSEGFATYMEGIIHARSKGKTMGEFLEERKIVEYLRYKMLRLEIDNAPSDLQRLRNSDGNIQTDSGIKIVKNGMNPDKGFMQFHYLKGYFLLRYLEEKTSQEEFHQYLKSFVCRFHHKLVTSEDVIKFFLATFPHLRKEEFSEETIISDWVTCPGLPKVLSSIQEGLDHSSFAKIPLDSVSHVARCNKKLNRMNWRKRRKLDLSSLLNIPKLQNSQLLLFLDKLTEIDRIHPELLAFLDSKLCLSQCNPDVTHKLCELIVKHRAAKMYSVVRDFLLNHQAMGVYLYGELIINCDKVQADLARSCYEKIKGDMEPGVRDLVNSMIYG